MQGCAYGVGVGPGDPELMTLKAVRVLRDADVIAFAGSSPADSTAFGIAVQAVPEIRKKELLPICVPMTRDRQAQEIEHGKTARLIETYLDAGKDVACLTLGDPSIYSSFSYYRKLLEQDGYRTKMISAVPSFCAVAAKLNIPLAEWEEPVHIIPALYQAKKKSDTSDPGKQSEDSKGVSSETYIYMKIGKQLKPLKESLKDSGAEVYMVAACGMEGERVYRTLEEIPDEARYFTTMIVKNTGKTGS